MSSNSAIEWTEATWNPVRGCTKVSPGCAHCYAETFAERFRGVPGHAYEQGFDLRLVPKKLTEPIRWKPQRIFVNSMSDLFQDGVPDSFINQVYETMEQRAPQHIYQVLTKRADRMRDYLNWRYADHRIPARHIWHGVSVENQQFLQRIDVLKDARSAVRFVSFEPLLEDLGALILDGIQWCIIGGESGPGARPFDVRWARTIVRQCRRQQIACFVKQLGRDVRDRNDAGFEGDTPTSWPIDTDIKENIHGFREEHQGAPVRVRLRHTKGGDPAEWPADLRIREYPVSHVPAPP